MTNYKLYNSTEVKVHTEVRIFKALQIMKKLKKLSSNASSFFFKFSLKKVSERSSHILLFSMLTIPFVTETKLLKGSQPYRFQEANLVHPLLNQLIQISNHIYTWQEANLRSKIPKIHIKKLRISIYNRATYGNL